MNGSETSSNGKSEPSSESPQESPLVPNRLVRAMAWLHPTHNAMMIDKIRRQNHVVQKQVEGMVSETGSTVSTDDMGDLSVGNEIHNHYTGEQKSSGGIGKTLATLALGTLLGVGGAGAGLAASHFFGDKGEDADTDTTVEMGLGKIEDYLNLNE